MMHLGRMTWKRNLVYQPERSEKQPVRWLSAALTIANGGT